MMVRILSIFVVILSTALHISLTDAQSISVNKACLTLGETFSVTFQNINELDTDWIAILPATENTDAFVNFGHWAWTCGTQTCTGAVAAGRVRMRSSLLTAGMWRAVLARDDSNGAPFAAYAVSTTFTIATSCSTTPGLTPAPALVPAPVAVPIATFAPIPVATVVPGPIPAGTAISNVSALNRINSAKAEILGLIRGDRTLAPQFLRLGFHDCIGGCDGTLCLFVCCAGGGRQSPLRPVIVFVFPKIRHMI